MKTFKLKSLEILENNEGDIVQHPIPLKDGLIINREDDKNHWVVEAYLDQSYHSFFTDLNEKEDPIMIQVKITKESNNTATLITSLISINEIGSDINVLFKGTIVDRQKGIIKEMLQRLVEEGYQGEALIKKFKDLI